MSVDLVGQKSVIYYIQMVAVALLSVDLVESVDLVFVHLVVNCTTLYKIPLYFLQMGDFIFCSVRSSSYRSIELDKEMTLVQEM